MNRRPIVPSGRGFRNEERARRGSARDGRAGIRLAYVCADPGIPPDGDKGASVHFREMARALRARGAELDVFVARAPRRPAGELTVVEPRPGKGIARELALLENSAALARAVGERGGHDAVYERLSLFSLAGATHARAHGLPFLLEVNAPLWQEAARYRSLAMPRVARAAAMEAMAAATVVTVVSTELADLLVSIGVDARRVRVVSNGVSRDRFEGATAAPRPAALAGRRILVFQGSLKPWHGVEFLLEAFARHRDRLGLGLWIVGDGPLRGVVDRAAAADPAIRVEGPVPHDRIPGILRAADVAVAPYGPDAPRYFSPLKVVEALAAGCPLVAGRVPCVAGLVRGAERVVTYEPGDLDDFGAALERASRLERPPGPIHVPEWMTWESKAGEILDLLAEASSEAGRDA